MGKFFGAICLTIVCAMQAVNADPLLDQALSMIDTSGDKKVSYVEIRDYTQKLYEDPILRAKCPNATGLLAEAGLEINELATTSEEIVPMLLSLLNCAQSSICVETVVATCEGHSYECVEEGAHDHEEEEEGDDHEGHDHEDDDHEGHNHDSHGDEVSVKVGDMALHCDEIPEEEELVTVTGETWGISLGAITIVSAVSLVGAFLLLCFGKAAIMGDAFLSYATDFNAFAIGVLLAAVLIHILPEAGALAGSFDWKVATAAIGGVCTSMLVEVLVHHVSGHEEDMPNHVHGASATELEIDDNKATTQAVVVQVGDVSHDDSSALILNVVFGDAFHNFSDGILIASSFMTCTTELGWLVTLGVICHELPQEFIDFIIILRHGGSVKKAICYNLLSAMTAYVGAIITLAIGNSISVKAQGLIIAYGSGVLLYIALVELAPRMLMEHNSTIGRKMGRMLLLFIGCSIIGLLQLFHPHCGDGHEGHDH